MPAVNPEDPQDENTVLLGCTRIDWGGGSISNNCGYPIFERRFHRDGLKRSPKRADGTRAPTGRENYTYQCKASSTPAGIRGGAFKLSGDTTSICLPASMAMPWGFGASPFPYTLINRSKAVALSKLAETKVSLGVALAESAKTASMVSKAAREMSAGLSDLKKLYRSRKDPRTWNQFMRTLGLKRRRGSGTGLPFYPNEYQIIDTKLDKAIANRVLELNYGWSPLVQDVVGSAEMLSETIHRFGHVPSISVRGGSGDDETVDLTVWGALQGTRFSLTRQWRCSSSYVFKMTDYQLRQLNQAGVINYPSVLWELIPYSFLVDQVIGIGQWLNNATATSGLTYVEGSTSMVCNCIQESVEDVVGSSYLPRIGGPSNALVFGKVYRRQTEPLPPGIQALPDMRTKLNLRNLANDLSLLVQKLR